jgi:hypothetical protein
VAASSGSASYQISGEVTCQGLPRPVSLGLWTQEEEGGALRTLIKGSFHPSRLGITQVEGAPGLMEQGLRLEVELAWRRADAR